MLLLEGQAAQTGQVRPDPFAPAEELLLVRVAAQLPQQLAEKLDLGLGRGRPLLELLDHRRRADAVGDLDLDEQIVTDERGLRHGRGELLQLGATCVGDLEETFVGPGLLDHLPPRDQSFLLQLGQLRVQLLRQGVPEVRDADVERLRQLVSAVLTVQQRRQHGMSQGHRSDPFPFLVRHCTILKKMTNHIL